MTDMQALAERYQRVVQETLGFEADIDEDMDVFFDEPELGMLFFSLDENDPEYLRLVFSGFTSAEDLGVTDAQLLEVLDEVNGNCKAAKIYVEFAEPDEDDDDDRPVKGMVTVSVESFLAVADTMPDEALLRAVVPRSLSAARAAAMELLNVVRQRFM